MEALILVLVASAFDTVASGKLLGFVIMNLTRCRCDLHPLRAQPCGCISLITASSCRKQNLTEVKGEADKPTVRAGVADTLPHSDRNGSSVWMLRT